MAFKPGSGAPPFGKKAPGKGGKATKPITRSPMGGRC
jgi:hypothetical protein